jgi:hypothetical protein
VNHISSREESRWDAGDLKRAKSGRGQLGPLGAANAQFNRTRAPLLFRHEGTEVEGKVVTRVMQAGSACSVINAYPMQRLHTAEGDPPSYDDAQFGVSSTGHSVVLYSGDTKTQWVE